MGNSKYTTIFLFSNDILVWSTAGERSRKEVGKTGGGVWILTNKTDPIEQNLNDSQYLCRLVRVEILLDADADTSISAQTDDQIDNKIANTENLKIGFNSNFILEALNNIKNENITMFLNGPLSAAILSETSSDKKTDKLILLMPIRLNE